VRKIPIATIISSSVNPRFPLPVPLDIFDNVRLIIKINIIIARILVR